jgi:hypothetical protein
VVNHWARYEATSYQRPYPGEVKVMWPSDFRDRIKAQYKDSDD